MAAVLPKTLVVYTNEDWFAEPWIFKQNGVAEDFTGASAKMGLRMRGAATNAAEFTTGNGELTFTLPNEIGITAPLAVVSTLPPGKGDFDVVVTYASGQVKTKLVGTVEVVEGLSP